MNKKLGALIVVAALAAFAAEESFAHGGFGGFHGGGGSFHAGGMSAGGIHAGGMGGGGINAGGMRAGGINAGGMRAGGVGAGGLNAGGMKAGGINAGGFNAGGIHAGGVHAGGFNGLNSSGFKAGGFDASGFHASGPNGRSVSGFHANAGGFGANDFHGADASKLNSFLGMPSDAGTHHTVNTKSMGGGDVSGGVARGPMGGVAAGQKYEGPRGGTAGRGVAVGPRGNVYGGRYATGPRGNTVGGAFAAGPNGVRRVSAVSLHNQGTAVRTSFRNYNYFGSSWYTNHPGAWYTAGFVAGTAWSNANWNSVDDWFGYNNVDPMYYNYGTNVVYENGEVYVNDTPAGSEQQYYQTAADQAASGAQQSDTGDQKWLPLGVFALTKTGQNDADKVFQLAVDKQGTIRGNYADKTTGESAKIQGAIDKQKQTAAWTVGSDTTTVYQTGIYNLTKAQAPCLVLKGKDKTEQMLLVRLQKPDGSDGSSN